MLLRRCLILFVCTLSIFVCGPVFAMVGGSCVNCHTMHSSQDGQGAIDADNLMRPSLTTTDCVGCHSSGGASTIVTLGETKIPIVFNSGSAPDYPPDGTSSSALAGGNFYWVAKGDDSKGHNVFGISNVDQNLSVGPGYPSNAASGCHCHSTLATADSGCTGCHTPRHHADDSATVVDVIGGSYRFLGGVMDRFFGAIVEGSDNSPNSRPWVAGIEAKDWEQNPSADNHNTYSGTDTVYARTVGTYLSNSSIGELCNGCHGNFHHMMNEGQGLNNRVPGFVTPVTWSFLTAGSIKTTLNTIHWPQSPSRT